MGLINKENVIVKTGTAVAKAGGTLVKNGVQQGTNLLVNRTSDFYEEHENLTDGLGNSAVGNGAMVVRSGARVGVSGIRSTRNIRKKKIARMKFNEKSFVAENGVETWKALSRQEQQAILNGDEKFKSMASSKRWEYYSSDGIKKGVGLSSTRESLTKSRKATISNQTRKGLSSIAKKDDMGSKTIGKSAQGMRLMWKNRVRAKQGVIKSVAIVKSVIVGVVGFVTSIPALITAIISSLPILIVVMCIVVVSCFFGEDLEYSGRISLFSEGEIQLENANQTNLNPEEILAISSVLGWTTPRFDDYEMLLSLAYNQKRGERVNFETMMDNVFSKYNPATKLNPTFPINENANTEYTFYTIMSWEPRVVENSIEYGEWLNLYPRYKKASVTEKTNMGTGAYIEDMKAKCREALELNGYNYLASFIALDNPPNVFTSYILDPNSNPKVSSPVGYRTIDLNGTTNKDFHHGTDIAVAGGTPVYAPADMSVVYADGSQTVEGTPIGLWGGGNVVILKTEVFDRKGRASWLYVGLFHLQHQSVSVKAGDKIKSGTQIATVGTTGTSTGNHLHMQTWLSSNNYTKKTLKWVDVNPKAYTDSVEGAEYDVNDEKYPAIFLEGLLFYDVGYRNKLYR